jgi:hypothetical protein
MNVSTGVEFVVDLIVDFSKAISWPVAVMILVLVCRRQLHGFINRISKVEARGLVVSLAEIDESREAVESAHPQTDTQPEAPSVPDGGIPPKEPHRQNYYWLGHDLMWTQDAVYRGATKEYILHGLESALAHLRVVGLPNQSFEKRLKTLHEKVSAMLELDLTTEQRCLVVADIRAIGMELGRYIREDRS